MIPTSILTLDSKIRRRRGVRSNVPMIRSVCSGEEFDCDRWWWDDRVGEERGNWKEEKVDEEVHCW